MSKCADGQYRAVFPGSILPNPAKPVLGEDGKLVRNRWWYEGEEFRGRSSGCLWDMNLNVSSSILRAPESNSGQRMNLLSR